MENNTKVEMVNLDGKKIENNSAVWANHSDMGENVFVTSMLIPEGYVAESIIQSEGIVMIRIAVPVVKV